MSHGIPVVFYPYVSYVEIAEDFDYRLPSGGIPAGNTMEGVKEIMRELSSSSARAKLREAGLAIAANFSAFAVARRLVKIWEFRCSHVLGYPSLGLERST